MPTIRQVVPAVFRFTVYLVALLVVATARLPDAAPSSSPAIQRTAERPGGRAAEPSAVRLLLAGLLAAGLALDVRGRRVT